jgi:kumamolisin
MSSHTILDGSQREPITTLRQIGVPDPSQEIQLSVKLRRKQELPDLEDRPARPLSVDELESQYGASDEDVEKVIAALSRFGLSCKFNRATSSVQVTGPISAVQEAFHPKLAIYEGHTSEFRGRSGPIEVPTELKDIVVGVFGLDERQVAKRKSVDTMTEATHASHNLGLKPADLEKRYSFPEGTGKNQCIGILEFGGAFVQTDLNQYCQTLGRSVPQVQLVGVDLDPETVLTQQNADASGEVMLDIELVAGFCPDAKLIVYFSSFDERGWVDALVAAVHDTENAPHVLSVSWGLAEDDPNWSKGAIKAINDALKEAALVGMTVCVASGDDGSGDQLDDGKAHVDFPSSSPYAVAVGGTMITTSGVEETWRVNQGVRDGKGGGSTGGGASVKFATPKWQKAVAVPSANPGNHQGRCIPDISALAGPPGHFMVFDGGPTANGGTSASAPVIASLIARLNENLGASKRVGYLTPLLYKSSGASTVGGLGCTDITVGNNVSVPAPGFGYQAGVGYDAATGWGVPNGTALLAQLRAIL